MSDLISRQAAIDALKDWYDGAIVATFGNVKKVINTLPSVQLEVLEHGEGELITDCTGCIHQHEWHDDCEHCSRIWPDKYEEASHDIQSSN